MRVVTHGSVLTSLIFIMNNNNRRFFNVSFAFYPFCVKTDIASPLIPLVLELRHLIVM